MHWMTCLATAAMLGALAAGAARADEKADKLDCADMDVQIKSPDFELSCKDFSSAVAGSSLGRLKAELLTAVNEKQGQFVAVWDIRTLGNTYIPRSGLESDVHDFFSDENFDEWHEGAPVADFEIAQYVNRRSGGNEEECIAFRRLMQRRSGGGVSGYARMVLGFGCTVHDRAEVIETLKQIDAPGG